MINTTEQSDTDKLLGELVELLTNFKGNLKSADLRDKVCRLIPAYDTLREVGKSLLPHDIGSARDRIIYYLKKYPGTIISGDELMVVAGIGEWARRVRELRVQFGWPILSGVSVSEMVNEEQIEPDDGDIAKMAPNDYLLLNTEPDRDAAYRWNVANEIRNKTGLSVRDKILEYLRANVGKEVTGEELRYVAKDKTEWARRVRELRTEYGWPVVSKQTGMPELPVGVYVLEMDRQSHVHDRKIPDQIRRAVLRRDAYCCRMEGCGWCINEYNRADPRILELHHKQHHVHGGENTEENLITLCNICHDRVHAENIELS